METKSISTLDPMSYEGLGPETKIPVSAGPGNPKALTVETLIDKASEELATVTQEQVTIEIVSTASLSSEKITVYLNGDILSPPVSKYVVFLILQNFAIYTDVSHNAPKFMLG